MESYRTLDAAQLQQALLRERERHDSFCAQGLALNMARGKPSDEQLDLSSPLLSILAAPADCQAADGTDCRNYGVLAGIPEARELMASVLDDDPATTIVLGSSSLTAMYDALARLMAFGTEGHEPWERQGPLRWLCPVPGYDRHFSITEAFGIEMLPVPLVTEGPSLGPAMDEVERLVAEDPSIKGIWCVPKYANPSGITYADDVVRRLAAMECAAPDFRIFWDNAYSVHHLSDDATRQDALLDIGLACREAGHPNRYLKFGSTSKVTFPGAGIAALAASPDNVAEALGHLRAQTIGGDKLAQLRHSRFLVDGAGIAAHMARHASILAPKFALVQAKLHDGLDGLGIARWSDPRGGYFVSFDGMEGTARRTVALAREAGVVLTGAGATWPYGEAPADSNLRIAPSLPPIEELGQALDVLVCCVRIAALEKLLAAAPPSASS